VKTNYIIIVNEDEEPVCVSKELESGTVSRLIIARTLEEAAELLRKSNT